MLLATVQGMKRPCSVIGFGLLVLLTGACEEREERMSGPAPPPAALIAPVRESMSLDERLAVLERELAAVIAGRLEGEAIGRMFRAEAISDRLLETNVSVRWLDERYYVESRLRQIQARSDRILAQIRRGESRSQVLEEVRTLHGEVVELRSALRTAGGRRPPVPFDSLMRGGRVAEGTRQPGHGPAPAEAPRRPAPLSEDDLLGVPVPDGGEP